MYSSIPEIMSASECQKLLRVGKNTMLSLLHSGQISAFKIGSKWKIPRESILEFIKYA